MMKPPRISIGSCYHAMMANHAAPNFPNPNGTLSLSWRRKLWIWSLLLFATSFLNGEADIGVDFGKSTECWCDTDSPCTLAIQYESAFGCVQFLLIEKNGNGLYVKVDMGILNDPNLRDHVLVANPFVIVRSMEFDGFKKRVCGIEKGLRSDLRHQWDAPRKTLWINGLKRMESMGSRLPELDEIFAELVRLSRIRFDWSC